MKQEEEFLETFKDFKAMFENSFNKKIKLIRYNKGGEYIKGYFHSFCESKGIRMEHSDPYTPQ